ncbi:S1 family peptidase [Mycolicibacterium obuense]|uniref:S1 family peptidase n=1 Tax=Mycolicibacterium obuense TaxID=1807 RepID=UPI00069ACBB2|nr:serine protease [Mycolicibacterium obuense]
MTREDGPELEAEPYAAGTLGWKIQVAWAAHRFFGLIHDEKIAGLVGRADEAGAANAWPVALLPKYLAACGIATGGQTALAKILIAMEGAGLLMRAGWDPRMNGMPWIGQLYISQGQRSELIKGNLWLSEVIGPDLVIQSYNLVTVQISGGEGKPSGTGLVLDQSHIVTNRHVLEGLIGDRVRADEAIEVHPSFKAPDAQWVSRPSYAIAHPEIDVAVITAEFAEGQGLLALPGMAFRNPRWDDDIRVFGFPYVMGLTEQPITVEHGDVVNVAAEAPAVGGFPRHKVFLTSAIERPGNSGGPIVAQDGRVVGLVVDHTRSGMSGSGPDATAGDGTPPFYRGIPAGEVVRAVEEMGFTGIAILEDGAAE